MKRLAISFVISILFFSCRKNNQVTIVGGWKEISVYEEVTPGKFEWVGPAKFPLWMTLTSDGKYATFNDVPASHGIYRYDYSTKLLSFESSSGSIETRNVSFLSDNYLVIDLFINGIIQYRQKFLRIQN